MVNVTGESFKNQAIGSNDLGSFYDRIDSTDNSLKSFSNSDWMKWAINIFIVVLLGATVYIVLKK